MTQFLSAVLWNTLLASLFTLVVGTLGRMSWFRRRPAVMHVLWLLVLAKFILPAVIPIPLFPAPTSSNVEFAEESVSKEFIGSIVDAQRISEQTKPVLSEPGRRTQADPGGWASVLIASSCFISAILILRGAIHGIRFHYWLKSVSQSDQRLDRLLERGREVVGSSNLPEVRSLDALCAPFLWAGGRQACIYIPQQISEAFDDEQLTGVLFHELAHCVRRDARFSLFASVVAAICWWNPLVWWASRQLRWTQELCCDAVVLELGEQSRRVYAETLLMTFDMVTHGLRLPSALASSWYDAESLKCRFQLIGEKSVMNRLSLRFGVVALFLGIALLCLPVRANVDPASTSQGTEAQSVERVPLNAPSKLETVPLYIHLIGNTADNSTVHLLTRRIRPSGEIEDNSSVKDLTGRLERVGEKYFAKLEYHLDMRDGSFQGEVMLDTRTFPVFVAASSVIRPVAFVITRDSEPAPYINQPLVVKTETATAVSAETATSDSTKQITGRIVDLLGKPLRGMQIVAAVLPPPPKRAPKPGRRMEWKLGGDAPPSATSDDEGYFTIEKADARATIMLQFYGSEFQLPRTWKPEVLWQRRSR